MDDATRIMRILGVAAMMAPFLLARIPALRPHARRIGLAALIAYVGFGLGFVVWTLLIRPGSG